MINLTMSLSAIRVRSDETTWGICFEQFKFLTDGPMIIIYHPSRSLLAKHKHTERTQLSFTKLESFSSQERWRIISYNNLPSTIWNKTGSLTVVSLSFVKIVYCDSFFPKKKKEEISYS